MKALIACITLLSFLGIAQAEETMSEKTQATTSSAKRTLNKGVNRTKEAFCGKLTGDSKVECMAKEAKNRVSEGADTVKDKAVEIKNNIDTDKE